MSETDDAVEALQDRLKFLEDELIRMQPEYEDPKKKRREQAQRKIVIKSKAEIEEEMQLARQKALFGEMIPVVLKKPVEIPPQLSRAEREKKKKKPSPVKIPQGGFLAELYSRAAAAAEAEKPREDPNALPLAPYFYSEKQEREFDKAIMDFDSAESKEQYKTLLETYGDYLGGGEEDLYELWKRLGGTHQWKKYLRPTQLSLLLSREKILKVRFRVEPEKLKYLDGYMMEEREVAGFFSNILPRLPHLQYMEIVDCPVRPFLLNVIEQIPNPFPALKGIYGVFVQWSAEDIMGLIKICKAVERGKVRVDPNTLVYSGIYTEKNLLELSGGKVAYVTAPLNGNEEVV